MDDKILQKNCMGCSACKERCPVGAISMQRNKEGFLEPVIDKSICIDCHLCERVCPVINPRFNNITNPQAYVGIGKDEFRKNSSSGGIFGTIADYILSIKGYVVGASFDTENKLVNHIIINSKDDLKKLQGSKYLQSDIKGVYKDIKELLSLGKIVLFSGTPCENAGLLSYLDYKEYDNLYMLDIVCHGTPSPKVFQKYLSELNLSGDFIETNFRDKICGWRPELTSTTTTTTTSYTCSAKDDDFMKAFLNNFCLRKSCTKCFFNRLPRSGDLTLGDFWGVNKKYDDEFGTSIILSNNKKGDILLRKIKKNLKLLKKVDISKAIPGNPCLIKSTIENPLRDEFFENLDKKTLKENVDCLINKRYDYLCLNFWTSINYGAILTAYALQELLKKIGYSSAHIDYRYPHITQDKFNDSFTDVFARKYLNRTVNVLGKHHFNKLNEIVNRGFIVGSDQVFRDDYIQDTYYYYLLGFTDPLKQRIAVSASFGKDSFELKEAKQFFDCFDNVSVREKSGLNFVKGAEHILDPVFLVDRSIFDNLIKDIYVSGDYIGYILDENEDTKKITDKYNSFKNIANKNISVEEFLAYIKSSKLFITDSFHGVCFAILYNIPFICLGNVNRGSSRFESLFESLSIDNFEKFDWNKINKAIEEKRKEGISWIKNALSDKNVKNIELRKQLLNYDFESTKIKLSFIQKVFSINRFGNKHILRLFGLKIKF